MLVCLDMLSNFLDAFSQDRNLNLWRANILVAAGKMTSKEMGMHFVDTLIISSGYMVSMFRQESSAYQGDISQTEAWWHYG